MSVKRYPVSNGLLIVRGKEAYDTFNLQNVMVILATDYDALAASVDRLTSDKARLATELGDWQRMRNEAMAAAEANRDRVRALAAALAARDATIAKFGFETVPQMADRIRALEAALREIIEVTSGERQVADDDLGGLIWVGKHAFAALTPSETKGEQT